MKVLNNYEAYWQQHLKDTWQLKVLQTLINIRINSFLDKYDETKIGKGASEIISYTKLRGYSLKNIAPRHFTNYYILFFSKANLVFKFNLVFVDWIIFSKTCLPFYLLILCDLGVHPVPQSFFFIRTSKILIMLTVAKMPLLCYYFSWKICTCKRQKLLLMLINLIFTCCERATLGMIVATFGDWLWLQLSWCSM